MMRHNIHRNQLSCNDTRRPAVGQFQKKYVNNKQRASIAANRRRRAPYPKKRVGIYAN
ncbi:MAG: hypothetical protein HY277_04875 [Ignavibacteriales bacterium]|nr:hypothetical protein [Ignavibacteriales bacterium]